MLRLPYYFNNMLTLLLFFYRFENSSNLFTHVYPGNPVLVNGQGLSATTYGQSVLLGRSMTRKGENISRNTSRQTFT